MSDFLTRVVARSLGAGDVLQPRVPSVYEPYGRAGGVLAPKLGLVSRETAHESIEGRAKSPLGATSVDDQISPSEAVVPTPLLRKEEQRNPILARNTITPPSTDAGPPPSVEVGVTRGPRQSVPTGTGLLSRHLLPRQPQLPGVAAQAAPDASVVRPPRRPNARVEPSTLSRFGSAPQAKFQVTIGRVEVRAVFPDPPVRRNTPAPARSTVSLDDYLNRRHRGQG